MAKPARYPCAMQTPRTGQGAHGIRSSCPDKPFFDRTSLLPDIEKVVAQRLGEPSHFTRPCLAGRDHGESESHRHTVHHRLAHEDALLTWI
jgi:hypothetical protein